MFNSTISKFVIIVYSLISNSTFSRVLTANKYVFFLWFNYEGKKRIANTKFYTWLTYFRKRRLGPNRLDQNKLHFFKIITIDERFSKSFLLILCMCTEFLLWQPERKKSGQIKEIACSSTSITTNVVEPRQGKSTTSLASNKRRRQPFYIKLAEEKQKNDTIAILSDSSTYDSFNEQETGEFRTIFFRVFFL